MSQETATFLQELGDTFDRVWEFLFGSVLRFLIIFGVVMFLVALTWAEGVVAGHLGIYALSAIVIGVIGRAVMWWKIQDEY